MSTRLLVVLTFWMTAPAVAQSPPADPLAPRGTQVRTVTDTLLGPVGGVAVDRLGTIYVADFRDRVYRVTPDGRTSVFATGLYGASGNGFDSRGRLLQSNFSGNFISRIERTGEVSVFAEGLQGPVGLAVGPDDDLLVVNCVGNSVSWVSQHGEVSTFAEDSLFRCPNGITRAPDSTHYVVNFSDTRVLHVGRDGTVRVLAVLPGGGNGHIAYMRGALYVTSFQGQAIFRVSLDGQVERVAGTGQIGEVDGPALSARFTFPNGIAAAPTGDRLYVNDYINRRPPTIEIPPTPRMAIRQITLPPFRDILLTALAAGGLDSLTATYRAWKSAPATAVGFTELEINGLGYALMGAGRLAEAIRVFELNVESYPNSFNVYDSLAEAHMNAGNRDDAIRLYRRSLDLNPGNTNATDKLKELGAR